MSMSKLIKTALGLLAAGAVLFIAGSVMGGKGLIIDKNFRIMTAEDFQNYTYTNMDMEAFESIDIAVSNIPVTFVLSENGKYGVEVSCQTANPEDIKVAVENKKLTIKKESQMYWFSFDLSMINWNKADKEYVTVYLPKESYGKIRVEDSNAPVCMEDMDIDVKELQIETSNAGVLISDIRSDEIDVCTSNGTVSMEDIRFKTDKAKITADTSNSGIILTLPDTGKNQCKIYANTSNAGVYVNDEKAESDGHITSKGDSALNLKTSNGKIEIFFGLDE